MPSTPSSSVGENSLESSQLLHNSVAVGFTDRHTFTPEKIFDAKSTKEVYLLFNCEEWLQKACTLNDAEMAIAVRAYHTDIILFCPLRIKSYSKTFAERTAHQN